MKIQFRGKIGVFAAAVVLAVALTAADGVELTHHPRQTKPHFKGHPRFVVEDPDAHGGSAQAAIPGKSDPGGVICSFYSYARPAGRYRITWRVKVDDNTIDDVVFSASTGGGGRGFARGSIKVKGTDFKQAGLYQEFSYTAEKNEAGFFGVSASWPGKGRVLIDRVRVVSEKLFTDRDLLERAGGMELPDEWILPHPSPPAHTHGQGAVVGFLWFE